MRRTSSVVAARALAAHIFRSSRRSLEPERVTILRQLRRSLLTRHSPSPTSLSNRHFSTESLKTCDDQRSEAAEAACEESTARPTTPDDIRSALLVAALPHVHEHGWTEDALAAGVESAGLPLASIGLASGGRTDLVSFFMDRCNEDLRNELLLRRKDRKAQEADFRQAPVPERIERALRMRLEMVTPYVRSKRWHEGMALGVSSPSVAAVTAGQLDDMASIVSEVAGLSPGETYGVTGRAAIVSAYAAAELHLLTDESVGYEETWAFLHQRVRDLETMAGVASKGPAGLAFDSDTVVAASAVATSLGGAVLSLARPAATGVVSSMASTIVPHIMTFMQPMASTSTSGGSFRNSGSGGTKASDYNLEDLPPFETERRTTSTS